MLLMKREISRSKTSRTFVLKEMNVKTDPVFYWNLCLCGEGCYKHFCALQSAETKKHTPTSPEIVNNELEMSLFTVLNLKLGFSYLTL